MFGTNHLLKEPNGLIIENYTKSEENLDKHVKSFVRPFEIKNANNPHYYNIRNSNKMYNIDGKKMNIPFCFHKSSLSFHNAPAYIAHYIYQSEETYIKRKIQVPRDDTGTIRTRNNSNIHDYYNNINNEEPKQKYSHNIRLFLKQYECE